MLAQRGLRRPTNLRPIRYEAVRLGLRSIAVEARRLQAAVHMPRIGSGLAGGTWPIISRIVDEELSRQDVP